MIKSIRMIKNKNDYLVIKPPSGLLNIDWNELWKYRELLYIFAWRDIKVRYKQTVIGIAWALFQPFVTMVIFSFFFGKLAKVPSEGVPYPIFVYSGLLFWNYFSSSLTNASNSLINEQNIIKKVYFPRLILPISATVTHLIDFGFSLLIMIGMMIYFKMQLSLHILYILPLLLIITTISSSGIGLFLSSVNVKYRDVRYILPFFIQILLYLTPVIYPVSIIPENIRWIMYLNPMSGVITIARSMFLNTGNIDYMSLLVSLFISFLYFLFGIYYFKKMEQYFADII